jgi:hypothetical protein
VNVGGQRTGRVGLLLPHSYGRFRGSDECGKNHRIHQPGAVIETAVQGPNANSGSTRDLLKWRILASLDEGIPGGHQ